ncbi:uncharacterized protein LOC110265283 [Arachis ipaensis]|uniref:uncharacterized protein LOC110265283 n=1 Tax=Arachis ipaensis TaxID=130454 RepID=UPI000A2B56C5|nr:uncharacterized protein LOC110265283 [Arachis ipaensis]XP_025670125.1 uncharacterized protein LOC112769887 [Arachis hypogaea]
MDFVPGLPRTRARFDAVWVIVDHLTKSAHLLHMYDLFFGGISKSRQKRYADRRQKPLEFKEGDHVFLKVIPTTGVGRAIKTKKLNLRCIGLFQILKRIGPIVYQMALPAHLSNLHDVFHISQLQKYSFDATHVIDPESVQ